MKAEFERKKAITLINDKATIIANAFRFYKFKSIRIEMTPQTNSDHLEYLSSGAYFVGLSLERFLIMKEEFTNWSKFWRKMSYQEFHSFVLKKNETLGSMGIKTEIEDDVVVEIHIPSEKDNYLNFWSWLRNIPIEKDPTIIGDAMDLVSKGYDLFLIYKDQCPTFIIFQIKSDSSVNFINIIFNII